VKPFLLLGTREDEEAAENEYRALLGFTGLDRSTLRRIRLEERPLPALDLAEWSGILLGGGPFNSSDPYDTKTALQQRVEEDLHRLMDEVVPADFPFLGACYGIGTLGTHQGAVVDRTYGEAIGRVRIELTEDGRADPLFSALPSPFDSFVGHKEAIRKLPPHAVLLASSPGCPVQAFKVGRNVYATQFHPELDVAGLCLRIEVYRHSGYFEPDQAEALQEMVRAGAVHDPPRLLRRFVELYARD
jgi:GMP synthase (glutamine-hydrolysing)